LVWGGSQPVAKPSTIWYRAREKQKCTALPRRGTHRAGILEPLILAVIRVALFLESQRPASFGRDG
jgi:hypothetical protein